MLQKTSEATSGESQRRTYRKPVITKRGKVCRLILLSTIALLIAWRCGIHWLDSVSLSR